MFIIKMTEYSRPKYLKSIKNDRYYDGYLYSSTSLKDEALKVDLERAKLIANYLSFNEGILCTIHPA